MLRIAVGITVAQGIDEGLDDDEGLRPGVVVGQRHMDMGPVPGRRLRAGVDADRTARARQCGAGPSVRREPSPTVTATHARRTVGLASPRQRRAMSRLALMSGHCAGTRASMPARRACLPGVERRRTLTCA